jgi:DNA anti-recombination protein RmuC
VTITAHPSSILRAEDDEQREQAMKELIADLRTVASWLSRRSG